VFHDVGVLELFRAAPSPPLTVGRHRIPVLALDQVRERPRAAAADLPGGNMTAASDAAWS
jgi:hypothetical protein